MGRQLQQGRRRFFYMVFLFLCAFAPQLVLAQEYPTKPVTLVIPMGPGGGHDLTFRAVTSVAADYLGQPILIKLNPGGSGAIGADLVAKAPPDGYTLGVASNAWSCALPAIEGRSKGPEYFEAICRINYNPTIIVTRPGTPFKTFKEMIQWAKANPGKLIVGTPGPWSPPDMVWKYLMKETGITLKIVPFDGGGPALVGLLGGHLDAGTALPIMYYPYKTTGKLIPLLFLEDKRHPDLPDVPTGKEEGMDGQLNMLSRLWRGVIAPKGTPRPIVDKLAAAFKGMTEDKSVVAMIKQFGDDLYYLGPDEFRKVWESEFELYKELGKIYKK
jgi:tripartite-type tricarboxylate transporter receptor subunit TctC